MQFQTHDGIFHADDVLAAAILCLAFGPDNTLIRSRVISEKSDVVFDVGGVFDALKFFDHHQRGFSEIRQNGIRYASAGLIWRQWGHLTLSHFDLKNQPESQVLDRVDEVFVQPIDFIDTGGAVCEHPQGPVLSLSSAIASLNVSGTAGWSAACDTMQTFLNAAVLSAIDFVSGRRIVQQAVLASKGSVVDIGQFVLGWQEHLVICGTHCDKKFIVYEDRTGAVPKWMISTIPLYVGARTTRKDFPKAWGGLAAKELSKLTGVEDAEFCHSGLFIAGARSLTAALALAELAD